jgi:hypothetical protein
MIRSGTTNPYTAENLARIIMMSLSKMDHFRNQKELSLGEGAFLIARLRSPQDGLSSMA